MLEALSKVTELLVGGEVGGLVGGLAGGSEGNTAVEGREALLADDRVERVSSVVVAGLLEGVSQRVLLGLQTDLDDLHGVHNSDGLGGTGHETSNKDTLGRGVTSLLVGEPALVLLEAHETDGHLGHDTGNDRAETLVETQGRLAADDVHTSGKEATGLLTVATAAARKLHAHLDRVER